MSNLIIPTAKSPLEAWLSYLTDLHSQNIDMGLERVGQVARHMNLTQPAPRVITVTGTNGKGTTCHTLESMVRALRTGNYSVVIGWLTEELTEDEHAELVKAADEGNAMGFIMRPVRAQALAGRQHSGLKIHSNLYH